jgi:hypothetical protein
MMSAGAQLENTVAPKTDPAVFHALISATANWRSLESDHFQALDWAKFIYSAAYHGVLPIVAQRILRSSVAIPGEVREQLRSAFQESMLRSFPLVQEVLNITRTFASARLPAIPYKGPALAEELWGSFSLRDCADLDFLVTTNDVDRAGELFEQLGYERLTPIPGHLRAALIRNASEEQFRHPNTGLLLELQWSPAPRVFGLSFNLDSLWQRTRSIDFAGERVLSPSPEDLLMLLCIHGWKHNWSRLLWVGDVAQLLQRFQIDWENLLESSRKRGLLGILSLGLQMAHALFEIPLPPVCLVIDPVIQRLANQLIQRMQENQPCSYVEWHRFMLAARDSSLDRTKQITRFLITPGLGEYGVCTLPVWASGGYRAVRIARVLGLMKGKTRE